MAAEIIGVKFDESNAWGWNPLREHVANVRRPVAAPAAIHQRWTAIPPQIEGPQQSSCGSAQGPQLVPSSSPATCLATKLLQHTTRTSQPTIFSVFCGPPKGGRLPGTKGVRGSQPNVTSV